MTVVPPQPKAKFSLTIGGTNAIAEEVFTFDLPDVEGYIVGRSDAQNPASPDLDLARFGGRERGVSRRHAALVYFEKAVHIIDLESSNGTQVNGRKIAALQAVPLSHGDQITFGELELVFRLDA